jgi:hypothetical protein
MSVLLFIMVLVTIDTMKEIVKEGIKEFEEEREKKSITFSTITQSVVRDYLESLNIVVLEMEPVDEDISNLVGFSPFTWQASEEEDTERAMLHLQQELSHFGIIFGRNNYKLYDVHKRKNILSLKDEKTGALSGGTDLILAPFGLDIESSPQQCCVAIELKTTKAVMEASNGLYSFIGQATMELVAANYHSRQLTLVVLTDLCSESIMLVFSREFNNSIAINKYSNVSLTKMATFISAHLRDNCCSERTYPMPTKYEEATRESESTVIALKKARVSDFKLSLNWEHFQEMLEEASYGSKERASIIREHFRSHDLPDTSYLSMFA